MRNYNPQTSDNQKEMLYEVDEFDTVIGPVSRAECHNETRKPWHRSTHIYLFNPEGLLYLSQRSLTKDTAPGEWTVSAGGHVPFGSTYLETALRETKEELKISIELEDLGVFNIDYGSEREFLGLFCGITSQTPQVNKSEVAQIKAFVLADLIEDFLRGNFDLSGGSRDTFQHLINSGKLAEFHRKSFKEYLL